MGGSGPRTRLRWLLPPIAFGAVVALLTLFGSDRRGTVPPSPPDPGSPHAPTTLPVGLAPGIPSPDGGSSADWDPWTVVGGRAAATDEETEEEEATRKLRGRVLARDTEDPIAGATISSRQSDDAVTDARGRFVLAVPEADPEITDLEVEAEGFLPWQLSRMPWREEIEVRLDRSAQLVVRVVSAEDGRPVPGVPVELSFGSLPDRSNSMTRRSDEEGRAVFSTISTRYVTVNAWGNGWSVDPREVSKDERFLFLDAAEQREIELPVRRTCILHGRVTLAAGEPVQKAWVLARRDGGYRQTQVDQGGNFRFKELLAGEYTLQANSGATTGTERTCRLEAGEVRRIDLTLPAGAWVAVAVRDADGGGPLAGAAVNLDFGQAGRTREGVTGAAGEIRLGPCLPGRATVRLRRAGYRTVRAKVEVRAKTVIPVSVTMDRGRSVSGRVVWPDGAPAHRARAVWFGGGNWYSTQEVRTGEDGSFTLSGLPDGEVELQGLARDEERRVYECSRTVTAGSRGVVLKLVPKEVKAQRSIEVVVSDADGRPVPRADLEAAVWDAAGKEIWSGHKDVVLGRATLDLPTEGASLCLWVYGARQPTSSPLPLGAAGFGPFPLTGKLVQVVLPKELWITGVVRDPAGRRVPRASVEASVIPWPGEETTSCWRWEVWTEADGTFRIGGLGAGTVELVVYGSDDLIQAAPIRVAAGSSDLEIRLDAAVTAVITVVDPKGRPVEDIRVDALAEAGMGTDPYEDWSSPDGHGRTGPDGKVRFEDLARSAPYRLICRRMDVAIKLAPRRIDGWTPRDTTVRLLPERELTGRAIILGGRPYDGERGQIWSWNRATGWEPVVIEEDGSFRERGFGDDPVALVWIGPDDDPYEEPEVEPDRLDRPVQWVDAGNGDVVIVIPLR